MSKCFSQHGKRGYGRHIDEVGKEKGKCHCPQAIGDSKVKSADSFNRYTIKKAPRKRDKAVYCE